MSGSSLVSRRIALPGPVAVGRKLTVTPRVWPGDSVNAPPPVSIVNSATSAPTISGPLTDEKVVITDYLHSAIEHGRVDGPFSSVEEASSVFGAAVLDG